MRKKDRSARIGAWVRENRDVFYFTLIIMTMFLCFVMILVNCFQTPDEYFSNRLNYMAVNIEKKAEAREEAIMYRLKTHLHKSLKEYPVCYYRDEKNLYTIGKK